MAMRVISVHVGRPRRVRDGGREVETSIWKEPREGPVRVASLGLEGDHQSDTANHGGPDKAVYAYPAEHYAPWGAELPGVDLPWGAFGENLTISGLLEAELGVGDQLRVGSAKVLATMPRLPCFKLGLRLGRPDVVRRMEANGRCGAYLRVVEEGAVQAGDGVELVERGEYGISIAELYALIMGRSEDARLLGIASGLPTVPERARRRFAERLAALEPGATA
jgi:MOSC domain-containing protein YiiM